MGQTGNAVEAIAEAPCEYRALPLFQLVNDGISSLKESINDGSGCSCSKVVAYIGYRLFSYSMIPLLTNALSVFLSLIFTIVTLPLRCCWSEANDWCYERLKGSVYHTGQSLWDLTCDVRQVAAFLFCCDESNECRSI